MGFWTVRGPQEPIGDLGASSWVTPVVDDELVARGERLELKGSSYAKARADEGTESEEDRHRVEAKATPPWRHRLKTPEADPSEMNARHPSRFEVLGTHGSSR